MVLVDLAILLAVIFVIIVIWKIVKPWLGLSEKMAKEKERELKKAEEKEEKKAK